MTGCLKSGGRNRNDLDSPCGLPFCRRSPSPVPRRLSARSGFGKGWRESMGDAPGSAATWRPASGTRNALPTCLLPDPTWACRVCVRATRVCVTCVRTPSWKSLQNDKIKCFQIFTRRAPFGVCAKRVCGCVCVACVRAELKNCPQVGNSNVFIRLQEKHLLVCAARPRLCVQVWAQGAHTGSEFNQQFRLQRNLLCAPKRLFLVSLPPPNMILLQEATHTPTSPG